MNKFSDKGAELLEAWRNSGLSRRKFCMQNGISYSSFNYWFRRLEKPASSGFDLVEVNGVDSEERHPLQVVFPSGAKVVLEQVPSVEWLRKLVS
jgi:hypothetical protein